MMRSGKKLGRRAVFAGFGAAALVATAAKAAPEPLAPGVAFANTGDIKAAIKNAIGNAKPRTGRIKLDLPQLAESGNSVPLTVKVDSPMTARDHVRKVWIFADRNPRARVATFYLGPRAGEAKFTTNIRLSGTQDVIAIAEMSNGRYWTERKNVQVTVGACDALLVRY
jgi:sulfur-oxidizing protein SoxY